MQLHTWFYSLKESLDPEQEQALREAFDKFLQQWKSHGVPVAGMIEIKHSQFVLITSDSRDSRPSGCSIDSLKRSVTTILESQQLEILDPAYVFYRRPGGDIGQSHFRELSQLVQAGELGPDTIVFDNSLSQSDDMSKWEVSLKDTWMKRVLN